MVRRAVMLFTAMTGPEPSARAAANPRTVRLALELLERTAGRRRRCRRCRNVIAENARKRGQAWSVCTACAQAIEDDARQLEIAPALFRQCVVCRTDIAHLRAGARTCGDACRNVLSRILGRRSGLPRSARLASQRNRPHPTAPLTTAAGSAATRPRTHLRVVHRHSRQSRAPTAERPHVRRPLQKPACTDPRLSRR